MLVSLSSIKREEGVGGSLSHTCCSSTKKTHSLSQNLVRIKRSGAASLSHTHLLFVKRDERGWLSQPTHLLGPGVFTEASGGAATDGPLLLCFWVSGFGFRFAGSGFDFRLLAPWTDAASGAVDKAQHHDKIRFKHLHGEEFPSL
jgi:hypothetical protein